jgi:hypothetical protein
LTRNKRPARTIERTSNQKFLLRPRFLQKMNLPTKTGQWKSDRFAWQMPVLKNLSRNLIGQRHSPRHAVPRPAAVVGGGAEVEGAEVEDGNRPWPKPSLRRR